MPTVFNYNTVYQMNKLRKMFLLCLAVLLTTSAGTFAQDTTHKAPVKRPAAAPGYVKKGYHTNYGQAVPATVAPVVIDKSLNGQYHTALQKMYNYQAPLVTSLYRNFMDTLNVQRHLLRDAQTKLTTQKKTIDTLQSAVNAKDQSLTDSRSKIDQVSFLGAPVSKATYNTIMWGLVLVLAISLIAVIYLSASSRREASYRIKLYEELSAEFQTYKTKANEKEKKLARELQTERNKLDEMNKK
jgi:hypothetical protein